MCFLENREGTKIVLVASHPCDVVKKSQTHRFCIWHSLNYLLPPEGRAPPPTDPPDPPPLRVGDGLEMVPPPPDPLGREIIPPPLLLGRETPPPLELTGLLIWLPLPVLVGRAGVVFGRETSPGRLYVGRFACCSGAVVVPGRTVLG